MWQDIIVWIVVAVALIVTARHIYKRISSPRCEECIHREECEANCEEKR